MICIGFKNEKFKKAPPVEEVKERKRFERKLREKEAAYRERQKNWESREQKKRADYQEE